MPDISTQEKAKELRREYARKWRANNPDKVKAANERYWLKQAKKAEKEGKNGSK